MVSSLRTATVSAGSPLVTRGMPAGTPALRWPAAFPGSNLDYFLDASAALADVGDVIVSATLDVRPSGSGELQIQSASIVGGTLTAWLSGGVAGRSYVVRWLAQTSAGRTFEWLVGLPILPDQASAAAPPAPSAGFGTPVLCTAVSPMRMDLVAPLSTSLAAIF